MQIEWQARREIVEIGRRLYDRGLVTATDGNISARIGRGRFVITPAGSSLGELKAEQLICVDDRGGAYAGPGKPTSELPMHLAAYRERPDINAVIHAHPPVTTGFTFAGESLAQCVIPEVVLTFGSIPTTDYATPATPEGAAVITDLIARHDALILDRHGTLTVGATLIEAFHKLEKVEYCAKVTLTARQIGNVRLLSQAEVAKLDEVRQRLGYGDGSSLCDTCQRCSK